jgi:hypothetical protein
MIQTEASDGKCALLILVPPKPQHRPARKFKAVCLGVNAVPQKHPLPQMTRGINHVKTYFLDASAVTLYAIY